MSDPTKAQPEDRSDATVEEEPEAADALVEEVSIDGMCGVY